jgi:hypothetical protein
MDDVKKDIISKTNDLYNLRHSRDILNSLFNLFDYQITLMNQIVLFSKSVGNIQNNSGISNNYIYGDSNSQKSHINHLININKDIMTSMIMKFLSKINSILNRYKNNKLTGKNNNSLKETSKPLFNHGKIINLLYSNNNNNLLLSNSSNVKNNNKFNTITNASPVKIKNHKNKNASISKSNRISSKNKSYPYFNFDNNSNNNTFLKNKEKDIFKKININNNSYRGLITDIKLGKNMKDKKSMNKSYSTINSKYIKIDLNDKAIKALFNLPIFYNSNLCTKTSKEE